MVLEKFDCSAERLLDAVGRLRTKRVLVIGDLMLDRFIWGAVSRISPEAPVPIVQIRTETSCLGGAANVAVNIRALGARPLVFGVIGADLEGKQLLEHLRALGAPTSGVIVDKRRSTTVKTRIIAHNQQVCRADREDSTPLTAALQSRLAEKFKPALTGADAVVISDYAKGLIAAPLLRRIMPAARSAGKIVCVDPKKKNLNVYGRATVITPNTLEAEQASGIAIGSTRDLVRAGMIILRQTGAENLLVTRGERGMTLFEGDSRVAHIPTLAKEVFDVTGAGDTVISTLALGMAAGLTVREAAMLSNIAAGIVVGKLGTASASPDELRESILAQAGR